MQTVKNIPRLDTCTSPQSLHKLQAFQMNTAMNMALRVTWCVFWNVEGNIYLSWVIICTLGNCILCVKQGLECFNFKTGITHTHTRTHRHGVALSKLDRFLWRSAFYSLMFHCHFGLSLLLYLYYYLYDVSLLPITVFDYYWFILVLNATSLLIYNMVFLWILNNNSGSVVMNC